MKQTEEQEFIKKRREIMLRGVITSAIQTYGWLMELNAQELLEDQDIRDYADGLIDLNEKLRHRKAMKYIPDKELEAIAGRLNK